MDHSFNMAHTLAVVSIIFGGLLEISECQWCSDITWSEYPGYSDGGFDVKDVQNANYDDCKSRCETHTDFDCKAVYTYWLFGEWCILGGEYTRGGTSSNNYAELHCYSEEFPDCNEPLLWDENAASLPYPLVDGAEMTGSSYVDDHVFAAPFEPAEDCQYWRPETDRDTEYLQARLSARSQISRISFRGSSDCNSDSCYPTKVSIHYSDDSIYWHLYREPDGNHELRGTEGNSRHDVVFDPPLVAQYVKFHSIDERNAACMRMQVYGCATDNTYSGCPLKMRARDDMDNAEDSYRNVRFGINGNYDVITGTGLALYVIDTSSAACSLVSGPEWFDTSSDPAEADRLVTTLTGLTDGLWVAAVTSNYGAHVTQGLINHLKDEMGIGLGTVAAGAKLAFVYQIGSPVSAIYRVAEKGHGGIRLWTEIESRDNYKPDSSLFPLGMQTSEISLSQIQVSGVKDSTPYGVISALRPFSARGTGSLGSDSWKQNSDPRYLIVDLALPHKISGFGIIGGDDLNVVKIISFEVEHSLDGITYTPALDEAASPMVYDAYKIHTTPSFVRLADEIEARYVKIHEFTIAGFALEIFGYAIADGSIDFVGNKYTEEPDTSGLSVSMTEAGLSWCLDGAATWWTVDLVKLYYLTGLGLQDTTNVVTLTDGTLDFFPFEAIGSRSGETWFNLDNRMRLNTSSVAGELTFYFTRAAVARHLQLLNFNTAMDGSCFTLRIHGQATQECPPGSLQFEDTCYLNLEGGTNNANYAAVCEGFSWLEKGIPLSPKTYSQIVFASMASVPDEKFAGLSGTKGTKAGIYLDEDSNTYRFIADNTTEGIPWCFEEPRAIGYPPLVSAAVEEGCLVVRMAADTNTYAGITCQTAAEIDAEKECDIDWRFGNEFKFTDVSDIIPQVTTPMKCAALCEQNYGPPYYCRSSTYLVLDGTCHLSKLSADEVDASFYVSGANWFYFAPRCVNQDCYLKLLNNSEIRVEYSVSLEEPGHTADIGILDTPNHWVSVNHDSTYNPWPWIKYEFEEMMRIQTIRTQGIPGLRGDNHVTGYYVMYADGDNPWFKSVNDPSDVSIIKEHYDQNGAGNYATHDFLEALITRAIYLIIYNWTPTWDNLMMRVQLYGCVANATHMEAVNKLIPLGMESGRIGMGQIFNKNGLSGTTTYASEEGARINRPVLGPMLNYWSVSSTDILIVDLIIEHEVIAMATKGGDVGCVGNIGVSYSLDMFEWLFYNADEADLTMGHINLGNKYLPHKPALTLFARPLIAKAVRFHSLGGSLVYWGEKALTFELYGSSKAMEAYVSEDDMGRYDHIEPETTTSSGGDATYSLWKEPASPWCADSGATSPWVEIDLMILYHIVNIDLLEGSSEMNISLKHGVNTTSMEQYIHPLTNSSILTSNDSRIMLPLFVTARILRIVIEEWEGDTPCLNAKIGAKRAAACPPRYAQYHGKCYYPWNGTLPQNHSEDMCTSRPWAGPGRLVSPQSLKELLTIYELIRYHSTSDYWTSLVSEDPLDPLSWTFGEGGGDVLMNLTDLWSAPPTGSDRMCAVIDINNEGKLKPIACSENHVVFCETEASVFPEHVGGRWTHVNKIEWTLTGHATYKYSAISLPNPLCVALCQTTADCHSVFAKSGLCTMFHYGFFSYYVKQTSATGATYHMSPKSKGCHDLLFSSGDYEYSLDAISYHSDYYVPEKLDWRNSAGWIPKVWNNLQWFQVNVERELEVVAFFTRGFSGWYPTTMKIIFTNDNIIWKNSIPDPTDLSTENFHFGNSLSWFGISYLPGGVIGKQFRVTVTGYGHVPAVLTELAVCHPPVPDNCFENPDPVIKLPYGDRHVRCLGDSTPLLIRNGTGDMPSGPWEDYEVGFEHDDYYWLGLVPAGAVTFSEMFSLRVDIWAEDGTYRHAEFESFHVYKSSENYKMVNGLFTGRGHLGHGDFPMGKNRYFSTTDIDDPHPCALTWDAAWWFAATCYSSILTGNYSNMMWDTADQWINPNNMITAAVMRIRPKMDGGDYFETNVAKRKPSYQSESSAQADTPASLANDGYLGSLNVSDLMCAIGTDGGASAWWFVDLLKEFQLGLFKIYAAGDHSGLHDFDVKIGTVSPSTGDTVTIDTAGFVLCFSYAGEAPGGTTPLEQSCDTNVTGRYVSIEKTDTALSLVVCEVEIYPIPQRGMLHFPCEWNDDCIASHSECGAHMPDQVVYNFTCLCEYYYMERNLDCFEGADLTVSITSMTVVSDTVMVRETPTDITINTRFTHQDGLEFVAVTGSSHNFNLTVHFSDIDCSTEYSYHWEDMPPCGFPEPTYGMADFADTSALQSGMPVDGVLDVTLAVQVTIPADICNFIVYACVSMFPSDNSSYIEMDWAYNISCYDVTTKLNCKPDIDLRMSDLVYITGTPILRGYVLPLEFQVDLGHTSGIYPVVPLHGDAINYEIHFFTSNIEYTDGTQPLASGATYVTHINQTDAQGGISIGTNITLMMDAVININLTACLEMNYLCFIVTNHETGSYTETTLVDNCLCMDVANTKFCDPEIGVSVESIDIPAGTSIIRGYNQSLEFNVTLHNQNKSLDIVELALPDKNFNMSIYLTDVEMTPVVTPGVMVELVLTEINETDLIQMIPADGLGYITGEGEVLVPRDTCSQLLYLCVKVVPADLGASYRLPDDFTTHILCVDATPLVNCDGLLPEVVGFTGEPVLVAVNQTVSFNVTWDVGTDILVDVEFGDGGIYNWSWIEEDHIESYGEHNFTTTYSFPDHGNYSVKADLHNDGGSKINSTDITVEPFLNISAKIYVFTAPYPTPTVVSFAVENIDLNASSSVVWCEVVYGDGEDNGTVFGMISEGSPLLFDHEYNVDVPDVTADIICRNHFSDVTKTQLVILRADFEGLNLTVDSDLLAFPINEEVPFRIEMTNGSHAEFNVTFDNTLEDEEYFIHTERLSSEEPFYLTHAYTTHGNYTVDVISFNKHFNSSTNTTVIIQNPIHEIRTTGPAHVAIPPGLVTLGTEPVDNTLLPPDEVFCERQPAPGVSDTVYDALIASNLLSEFEFVYDLDHVTGDAMLVNVSCYNLASHQTSSWSIEAHQVIQGLTATLEPPHVITSEDLLLSLSLVEGSSVLYEVDWGDGEKSSELHPDLFANSSLFSFTHIYTSPGNYTLNITPSNPISGFSDLSYEVIVQNKIQNLILTAEESVLWPDGLVNFNIETGPTQADLSEVHCNWNLGIHEDPKQTYVSILDTNTPFPSKHEFTRESIGLANVTVNCSNLVSMTQLNVSIDIILDEVILDGLFHNGTVWWQNSSTFSLEIGRFGTNSCFVWDFDDGEPSVVYGVTFCSDYAANNGFEFLEIEYDRLFIEHPYLYEWPGEYNMSVYGFNHVNNVTLMINHTVLDWLCFDPNITLPDIFNDSGTPYIHMKSKEFTIPAEFTQYCWKSNLTRFNWTILDANTESAILEVLEDEVFQYTSRLLDYGQYIARFYVTMFSENPRYIVHGVDNFYDALLDIIPTPLRVKIKNGMADGAAYNRKKELNAIETTFDPDTDDLDKSGMEFMWFCKLAEEEWPMDGDWIARSPPPGSGGCYGKGAGPMGEEEGSFIINTFNMKVNTLYHIAVEVSKDIRRGSYEMEFFVGAADPPIIVSECIENCGVKAKWAAEIAYGITCTDLCETKFGELSVVWRLFIVVNSDTDELEEIPSEELESITQAGIRGMNIYFKNESLEAGNEFMLIAFAETPGSPNATQEMRFLVNIPPYDGGCKTLPLNGTAADTLFNMLCSAWKEWRPPDGVGHISYMYKVAQGGATRSMLFHSHDDPFSAPVMFPVGNPYDDFRSDVTLVIEDSLKDFYYYGIPVRVFPPMLTEVERAQALLDITTGVDTRLTDLQKANDTQGVTMLVYAMTSLMNLPPGVVHPDMMDGPFDENFTAEVNEEADAIATIVRSALVDEICKSPVTDSFTLMQVNEVLFGLLQNPRQIAIGSLINAADRVKDLANFFEEFRGDLSKDAKRSLAKDLIGTSVKVAIAGDTFSSKAKGQAAAYNASDPDSEPVNGTLVKEKLGKVMKPIVGGITKLEDTVLIDMRQDEPEVLIDFPELSVQMGRESMKKLDGGKYQSDKGKIRLPKFKQTKDSKSACIERRMLFSDFNMYVWDKSADDINSTIIKFKLEPCRGDQDNSSSSRKKRSEELSLLVADEPFGMEVNMKVEPEMEFMNATPIDSYKMLYSVLNLTVPVQPVHVKVIPLENQTLTVFVKIDENPSPDDYDWTKTVPDNVTDPEYPDLAYTLVLPVTNLTNGTAVYVGVQLDGCLPGTECVEGQDVLQYYISIQNGGCRTWDEENEMWTFDNCEVEKDAVPSKAKFTSNLFGSFGAGLFTPPNMIDFGSVFDDFGAKLVENMPVVATVIAVLILYIPFGVICRKLDKKDKFKWACLPLIDNFEKDNYEYELHVYTGQKKNAGTKSKVYFQLYGQDGDTGVRQMEDGVRDDKFATGEMSLFLMKLPDGIGNPVKMNIWHDNSGLGQFDNWYLSKIILVDRSKKEWYVFQCEKWLDQSSLVQRTLWITNPDDVDPNSLLPNNLSKGLFDEHIWLSVGRRKTKSTFTRLQRLSVCIATLFLAMVCNAMWYNTGGSSNQAAFSLGPISISVHDIYTSFMSSIIMLPPLVIITTLFAKAGPKPVKNKYAENVNNSNNATPEKAKAKNGKWPYWCVYIAWILLALSVAVGAFFTILYSFSFGGETSKAWLIAFILCFLQSLLIIQPLKVVIMALMYSFLWKNDTDSSEYEVIYGKMDQTKIKQLSAAKYDCDDGDDSIGQPAEALKTKSLDTKMRAMMKEILFYSFFIFLLVFVVNGNQDENVFWQNQDLRNNFDFHGTSVIRHPADMWKWVKNTVIPNLYYTEDYRGQAIQEYDVKFLENTYAMRLGPPRLRQIRVVPGACEYIPREFGPMSLRCTQWHSISKENIESYSTGWAPPSNSSVSLTGDPAEDAYIYQSEKELNGASFWGYLHSYSGGGYIANLGNTKEEAEDLVTQLESNSWIDQYTRAVLLEFNVWNANTNLFNLLTISVEFPNFGSAFTWRSILSVQLYRYNAAGGVLALFAEIGLAIFVTVMGVMECMKIHKQRRRYFKSLWNVLVLILITIFFLALGFYVVRSIKTKSTVEEMMNNRGKSINFTWLATFDRGYMYLMGFVTFLAMLKLLHILRYNKTIAILATTLSKSSGDLAEFGVVSAIPFTAFTFGAALMFNQMEEYSSLPQAGASMTQAFLGKFDFHTMMATYGKFGAVYLWIYLTIMIFLIMNVFIVIINEYLSAVSGDESVQPKDHEVLDHLITTFSSIIKREDNEKGDKITNQEVEKPLEPEKKNIIEELDIRIDAINATLPHFRGRDFDELVEIAFSLCDPADVNPEISASSGKSSREIIDILCQKQELTVDWDDQELLDLYHKLSK